MLEDKLAYYEKNKKLLYLTPAQYKDKYDFLREVDSLALSNAQLNLEQAYDLFFKNPNFGHPRFKSRKNARKTYTTNAVNNNIRLEDGRIKLPKIGYVKIKQHRLIPELYTLKSCTVIKTATEKYFVAIRYSYEQQIKEQPINTVGGLKVLDNGLMTSDNSKISYPLNILQTFRVYKKQVKVLAKMQNGSNNYLKQWKRMAITREKLSNQINDYLHKATKQIANAYDCIAVEDMDFEIVECSKSENDIKTEALPNLVINFLQILSYKLEESGKKFMTIDKESLSDQPTATEIKEMALKAIAV